MSDEYLWDKSGPEDPEVARLEKLLAPLGHTAPLDELRLRRPRSRMPWLIAAGAVAAAALALVIVWPRSSACGGGTGFRFTSKGGEVACGEHELASGILPVGGTLDTQAHEAELAIADIGTAQLGAHTRVRLERTSAERHQLYLERGDMHAKVKAPPRLFAVTTPATEVTDLGCEYAIHVEPDGSGTIKVVKGKVELDEKGGVVVAPAGTHAEILKGNHPGFPVVEETDPAFEAAVIDYEHGVTGALDRMLAHATARDAITLVNLVIIEPGHLDVLRRLGEITSPPDGITVAGAASDPKQRGLWREAVVEAQITVDILMMR